MSDLASRLRAEACSIRPTADPGLADRVRAHLPAELVVARPPLRLLPPLAVAAALIAALSLLWLAAPAPVPAPAPLAVSPPAPPTLSEMLGTAGSRLPAQAFDGELLAIGSDLASVALAVRSAVPF